MDNAKELKKKIERIPAFEEKLGIKYENISIQISTTSHDKYITILGNIMENNSTNYPVSGLSTIITIYDNNNDILEMREFMINMDDFMGFDTFKIEIGPLDINYDTNIISKILIYPKKEF